MRAEFENKEKLSRSTHSKILIFKIDQNHGRLYYHSIIIGPLTFITGDFRIEYEYIMTHSTDGKALLYCDGLKKVIRM